MKKAERVEMEVKRIIAIELDAEAKRHALLEMPVEAMTEEKEDALFTEYTEVIEKCISARYDAQVKTFKPNEWFLNFLNSFEDCTSKKISAKQGEIFRRYLPDEEQLYSYSSFHGKSFVTGIKCIGEYNGKIYKVQAHTDCAYLTIKNKTVV